MLQLVDLFRDDKDVLSVLLRFLGFQDAQLLSSVDRMAATSALRAQVLAQSKVRLPLPRSANTNSANNADNADNADNANASSAAIDWPRYYSTTFLRGMTPRMLTHITAVSIPRSELAPALAMVPALDSVCIWSAPKQALLRPTKKGPRRRQHPQGHHQHHQHQQYQQYPAPRGANEDLRRLRIMNLTHFKALTSLRELHLHRSDLVSFPAISALTGLRSLDLSGTRLLEDATHLKHLASLPQLTKLNLCATRLRDTRFLRALTQLQWLDLEGTKVSSLVDVQELTTLEYLNMSDLWLESHIVALPALTSLRVLLASYVDTYEPMVVLLASPALQKCDFRASTVLDLGFLSESPLLRSLDIRDTKLHTLSVLRHTPLLRKLALTAEPVALRSVPWASLSKLEELQVETWHAAPSEYEVVDSAFLPNLSALHTLTMDQMSDFSWVTLPGQMLKKLSLKAVADADEDRLVELAESAPRLDVLHLRVQHGPPPVVALQAFGASLRELRLVDAVTEDFAALAECTQLEMLDLSVRETATWRSLPRDVDFTFLTVLTNLHVLWLTGRHDFRDVALLAVLHKLEILRLDKTRVSDVSALATMRSLKQLSLDHTRVTVLPDCRALTRLEVIGLPAKMDCAMFHEISAFPVLCEIWHEEGFNCFWTGHDVAL